MATETKLPKLTPVCTQTVVHYDFNLAHEEIVEALTPRGLFDRIHLHNFTTPMSNGDHVAWCVVDPWYNAILRYVIKRSTIKLVKPKREKCLFIGGPDGITCVLTLSVQH